MRARRRSATVRMLSPAFLLAGGGVVVAVAALLEGLRQGVAKVDEGATAVWIGGRQLAQHTQFLHVLSITKTQADSVVVELERNSESIGGTSR